MEVMFIGNDLKSDERLRNQKHFCESVLRGLKCFVAFIKRYSEVKLQEIILLTAKYAKANVINT
ncbi:CLUMA_CG008189, isoform A [Clunio marinus]|uniref:CLUMA_CG008189, isoform A n=1 Tax=Clunio marinus TaxID=568069 RepID=A0A1J1I8E9_9DIPT|nr:CLUMA_CG008189, isoform A [Clunio marinus]